MSDQLRFAGDLDGYLEWAQDNFDDDGTWCARHWARCPVDGENGLLASVRLMQAFVSYLVPDDVHKMPEPQRSQQVNSLMMNRTRPICCELGDEYMDRLWAGEQNPDHPDEPLPPKWTQPGDGD